MTLRSAKKREVDSGGKTLERALESKKSEARARKESFRRVRKVLLEETKGRI